MYNLCGKLCEEVFLIFFVRAEKQSWLCNASYYLIWGGGGRRQTTTYQDRTRTDAKTPNTTPLADSARCTSVVSKVRSDIALYREPRLLSLEPCRGQPCKWACMRVKSNGVGTGWEYWIKPGCSQQSPAIQVSRMGVLDMARLGVNPSAFIGRSHHTVDIALLESIIGSMDWALSLWWIIIDYSRNIPILLWLLVLAWSFCSWFFLVLFWPLSALPLTTPFHYPICFRVFTTPISLSQKSVTRSYTEKKPVTKKRCSNTYEQYDM